MKWATKLFSGIYPILRQQPLSGMLPCFVNPCMQLIAVRSMRENAGQTVKSSVFHSWTRDTRDDRLLGTRGSYLKTIQELAGLGGDASFFKTEVHGQISRPLFPHVVSSTVSTELSRLLTRLCRRHHLRRRSVYYGQRTIGLYRFPIGSNLADPLAYDPSGLTAWDLEMVVSTIILMILLKL